MFHALLELFLISIWRRLARELLMVIVLGDPLVLNKTIGSPDLELKVCEKF